MPLPALGPGGFGPRVFDDRLRSGAGAAMG